MMTFNSKERDDRIQAGENAANAVIRQMSNAGNEIDSSLTDTVKAAIIAAFATGSIKKFESATKPVFKKLETNINNIISSKGKKIENIAKKYNDFQGAIPYNQNIPDKRDDNISEKISVCVLFLQKQIRDYTAAAMGGGKNAEYAINEYLQNKNKPYKGALIISNMEKGIKVEQPEGRGNYKSAYSEFRRMSMFFLYYTYTLTNRLLWTSKRNIVGYSVTRNSAYPCEICDSLLGKIFPLSDNAVPAHPHCVCSIYPVFDRDL